MTPYAVRMQTISYCRIITCSGANTVFPSTHKPEEESFALLCSCCPHRQIAQHMHGLARSLGRAGVRQLESTEDGMPRQSVDALIRSLSTKGAMEELQVPAPPHVRPWMLYVRI